MIRVFETNKRLSLVIIGQQFPNLADKHLENLVVKISRKGAISIDLLTDEYIDGLEEVGEAGAEQFLLDFDIAGDVDLKWLYENLTTSFGTDEASIERVKEAMAKSEGDVQKISKAFDLAKESHTQEIKAWERKVIDMGTELSKLKLESDPDVWQRKLQAQKDAHDEAMEKALEYSKDLLEARADLEVCQSVLDEASKKAKSLNKQILDLETQNRTQVEALSKKNKAISELKASEDLLGNELEEARKSIKELKESEEKLAKELGAANKLIEERDEEIEDLTFKLGEEQETLKNLEEQDSNPVRIDYGPIINAVMESTGDAGSFFCNDVFFDMIRRTKCLVTYERKDGAIRTYEGYFTKIKDNKYVYFSEAYDDTVKNFIIDSITDIEAVLSNDAENGHLEERDSNDTWTYALAPTEFSTKYRGLDISISDGIESGGGIGFNAVGDEIDIRVNSTHLKIVMDN